MDIRAGMQLRGSVIMEVPFTAQSIADGFVCELWMVRHRQMRIFRRRRKLSFTKVLDKVIEKA